MSGEIRNDVVFVVDQDDKPLLPTCSARGRLLLKKCRATLVSVIPYTIKLNRRINNPVGEFKVGIDDGAKEVGIAVLNEYKSEIVFRGTIRLRQDVSRKVLQRSQYRRSRRNRKTRYRQKRFSNRKQATPFPGIRHRKDSINRVLDDIGERVNITGCIVEQGQFDTSSLIKGNKLEGIEYQKSDFEGHNNRAKVLWRDNYTCQRCGSKNELKVHHIIAKSEGGTDTLINLITLCSLCHNKIHKGEFKLSNEPVIFKYPQYLQQGKWYLYNLLKSRYKEVKVCFGWMTSKWRELLNLEKSHSNDAISIACKDKIPVISSKDYLIIPKRKKLWEDNPTKTCEEKKGFRHYDLVKSVRKGKIIIGSVRSLKEKQITLRTKSNDNFGVSYRKTKLLYRFRNIIYV